MKKILVVLFVFPFIASAQKEIKPSVNKAETALQKGNFEEAKQIIDATVASQEYMVDKKGQPSKNAAKAWYLKGMIYTGIDTTKVEKFKSLSSDPFSVAKEAFLKSEEIDKGKSTGLVNKLIFGQPLEMTKIEVSQAYAQAFLNRGYDIYQKKDYKKAFVDIEKVVFFLPDTAQLKNAGVYFAPQAGENEKALSYLKRYFALGGKDPEAYISIYSIYAKKADAVRPAYKGNEGGLYKDTAFVKNTGLALAAAQYLTSHYPSNTDYLNMEYGIYTATNRLPEAKGLMEKRAAADSKDRESRYLLSLICNELKDEAGARKWIEEALKADPDYFEANQIMAKFTYGDAQKLRDQRNAISGSKDADLKKRQDLFKQIPIKLKESLVYWEKCKSLNDADADVLYGLLSIYSDISLYDESFEAKITELKKKMKAQGLEVD